MDNGKLRVDPDVADSHVTEKQSEAQEVPAATPATAPPPAVATIPLQPVATGTVPYQPAQVVAVAPKNPGIHLLVSVFLPGVGSMMNGDVGKGVGILIGYVVSFFLFFLIIPLFIALGLWIWGLVDAYQGAQKWNRAHGILS
jgi:TM2 domain-containing membrane protein YozV